MTEYVFIILSLDAVIFSTHGAQIVLNKGLCYHGATDSSDV